MVSKELMQQLASLAPLLAGTGSFLGGILLILGGAILAGLVVALLGIMLMLFYARLVAMQQQQLAQQAQAPQQATAQMGQEFGQQGVPQQGLAHQSTLVAYPPYPPQPIVYVVPHDQGQQQGVRRRCIACNVDIPQLCNTCPYCGTVQSQVEVKRSQQAWRGF